MTVDGTFVASGGNQTVQTGGFSMGTGATLWCTVDLTGLLVIDVTGTATLDGQLQVVDVNAPLGTYTVLQAGTLTGSFATVLIPPGWSLSIVRASGTTAAGSVVLTKGSSPVEPETWGGTKSAYR